MTKFNIITMMIRRHDLSNVGRYFFFYPPSRNASIGAQYEYALLRAITLCNQEKFKQWATTL